MNYFKKIMLFSLYMFSSQALEIHETQADKLLHYIEKNNYKKVALQLRSGYNANATNRQGRSALYRAVTLGHTQCVKVLLDYGANPDTTDETEINKTILWRAIKTGSFESVKLLDDFKTTNFKRSLYRNILIKRTLKSDNYKIANFLFEKNYISAQDITKMHLKNATDGPVKNLFTQKHQNYLTQQEKRKRKQTDNHYEQENSDSKIKEIEVECCICYELFSKNSNTSLLSSYFNCLQPHPSSSDICKTCIQTWIKEKNKEAQCPLCRGKVKEEKLKSL